MKRIMSDSIKKKQSFLFLLFLKLVVMLLACLFSLVVLEIILRFLGPPPASAPLLPDAVLHHIHMRDFAYRSYDPRNEFGNYVVYWDSEGLVADPEKKLIRNDSKHLRRVAVMGDSFVEAGQVSYVQSAVGLLNQSAAQEVFFDNWGVSSYSPILYLPLWRTRIAQTKPEHVFLLLYENDISGDEEYAKCAEFGDDGFPIRVVAEPEASILRWLRRSSLFRFLRFSFIKIRAGFFTERDPNLTEAGEFAEISPEISDFSSNLLLQLKKEVEASGARFTLMAVPSRRADILSDPEDGPPSFASRVAKWCQEKGVGYLDLEKAFRKEREEKGASKLFFQRDIHFKPKGHELMASEIQKMFLEYFSEVGR